MAGHVGASFRPEVKLNSEPAPCSRTLDDNDVFELELWRFRCCGLLADWLAVLARDDMVWNQERVYAEWTTYPLRIDISMWRSGSIKAQSADVSG